MKKSARTPDGRPFEMDEDENGLCKSVRVPMVCMDDLPKEDPKAGVVQQPRTFTNPKADDPMAARQKVEPTFRNTPMPPSKAEVEAHRAEMIRRANEAWKKRG